MNPINRKPPTSPEIFSSHWLDHNPLFSSKILNAVKTTSLPISFLQTHLAVKADVKRSYCHYLAPWVGDPVSQQEWKLADLLWGILPKPPGSVI